MIRRFNVRIPLRDRATLAADLTLPDESIKTKTIADWKKNPAAIGKRPYVWLQRIRVLRLDPFVGQRMSASGMLIGTGGVDGLNVTTVNRVAENCP